MDSGTRSRTLPQPLLLLSLSFLHPNLLESTWRKIVRPNTGRMRKQRGLRKQKWALETGPSVRRLEIIPPQEPDIAVGDVCAADMTPGDGRSWLPAALLLLHVPGCWSLRGPTSVTGTVGGSLSVQCQYEEKFKENVKYWCKTPCMRDIVKTEEADKEVRSGRVSIRDQPANLTFTVTLENLTEGDTGTYRCGIDTSWLPEYLLDLTFRVVLSVTPASTATPSSERLPSTPGLPRTLPAPTWDTATRRESSTSSQRPGPSLESHPIEDEATEGEKRSLLGSVHFLLLILLKVPLFLMMLSAVFWVNRPQWAICGHQSQPDEDNLQPSLPIDILSRDNTTQTRRGRTSGPRPVSSPLIAKNW
ncbi:CMRF35-like molecule 6 isoform X4 [Lutra lutra]|uniref:CMRF35-like molecule 6 isoform X4 n=1 Tax=Lutra lutra TaxID=9657 RepID=UPI001FD1E0BB|nr:CMRF35-like molecule 6 isoform X4 [Lutra lutra]